MSDSIAVVCLSGGLDSCVTVAEAVEVHSEIAALHLSYGQRTQSRELESFHAVCDHYGIRRRLVVDQPALEEIGASALTDTSLAIPEQISEDTIPVTYVPFRNGQILAIACAWAESLGARDVYLGAVQEDSSGYPDCREEFFEAFEKAVRLGTRPESELRLRTPVLHFDKAQIVRRGLELGAPLASTWSCYQDEQEACGVCESCRLRLTGFERAGQQDPIAYRTAG